MEVADNSGARRLSCILPRGGDLGLRAGLGDVVTAAVKEAAPDSAIKKGKVVRCVIVRMRKETRRKDGTYIRFDSNAAVLINDVGEPEISIARPEAGDQIDPRTNLLRNLISYGWVARWVLEDFYL